MYTEDDIGDQLSSGAMSVEQALELFRGDEVYVYGYDVPDPATATWGEVEDYGGGTTFFFDAQEAGATPEQMDEFLKEMDRHKAAGRTISSLNTKT